MGQLIIKLTPPANSQQQLKTCPPRLNGALVLSFISRFASLTISEQDQRDSLVLEAENAIKSRCLEIDSGDNTFQDLDTSVAIPPDDPLYLYAQWPDRDAGRGTDYAF